ncbi:MAG: hypothetical protein O2854_09145 [Chloroflexi bacterium]|nr:hypothetical protein [Chloroflexota bacterium]
MTELEKTAGTEAVVDAVTPDVEEVAVDPAPEPAVELVEEASGPLSLDDIVSRVSGMVKTTRVAGVSTVARRILAAADGFFSGLAGDDEKKPKR